ncbi:MAG: flavodoxin domain-containing protein [Defluviitaleaceae bacterium]|nr:flavodoxin domain-containing protein [Defluviitaleaceae bacterium]
MKTLILYASKHGATKEIAGRIEKKMGDATLCDLKQGDIPPLADFDCIIIGSSLYAGSIRKEAKAFAAKNAAALGKKACGLFLSGLAEEGNNYFATNFPKNLLDKVKTRGFLGGIFDPKKANVFERFVIKTVMKQSVYIEKIDDTAIDQFVNEMKK